MNVELVQDLLTMLFYGFDANVEFAGDLLIGETLGYELQHFGFA